MSDLRLGRVKSPFDENDYNLRDFIPRMISTVTESNWQYPAESLDQKDTPHCVGFSIANFGINLPTFTPYKNADGDKFYYKCKEYDGQPGMENGSCSRSAAKTMVFYKMISAYAFALEMQTLKYWVLNKGPVIVGTIWTNDMFIPDEGNVIHPTGDNAGGHEYILNGFKDGFYKIHNSWGDAWGLGGEALISELDFEKLFAYDGEALTAVELDPANPPPINENPGCFTVIGKLWKNLHDR